MKRKFVKWGGMYSRFWGLALIDTKPLVGFKLGLTYSWSQYMLDFTLIFVCLRVQMGYHFVDPRKLREEC